MTKSEPSTPRRSKMNKVNAAHKRMPNRSLKKRPECKLPKRAGYTTQTAWDRNDNKADSTLTKYRTGYRKAWDQPAVQAYMKKLGFKAPGTYNQHNQQAGEMFSLPSEFKLTNTQAGKIMTKCLRCKNLTISNLKDIKKMLSFAYQLSERKKGNWPEVAWVYKNLKPLTHKPADPDHKVKATIVADTNVLTKAFTTEFHKDCGMEYLEWCVAVLLGYDLTVFGLRQKVDVNKIRDAKSHTFAPSHGWMSTEFKDGRAKLEKHKFRMWKLYRVCLCPGGKHKRPPTNWKRCLDLRGNPRREEPLPWCTTCPLNAFEVSQSYLPKGDHRTYPAWNPSGCFHESHQVGENRRQKFFQRWINGQKANPDNLVFDSNGGRKALAKWCKEFDVPYEHSFEIHGDHYSTWKRYYQHFLNSTDMDRRTQSPDPDECCVALRAFARGIGRGEPKDDDELTPKQQAQMLKDIMLTLGRGQRLQDILGKKEKKEVKKEVKTEDDRKNYSD